MTNRWYAFHYGLNYNDWGVHERQAGVHEPELFHPSILTWLTEHQAIAIAKMLNDMCGYTWCDNHPDWCEEMKQLRALYSEEVKKRWKEKHG